MSNLSDLKDLLNQKKIIAILRKVPIEELNSVATALCNAGICFLEVTFDQASLSCISDTSEAIRLLKNNFPSVHVGAGTVLTGDQVSAAAEAGAEYIISPNVDIDVIHQTVNTGMMSIPGAYTPSEIVTAYKEGASYVKIFPANSGGASYIKAIRGPLSHIPLLAVGGVDLSNMEEFYKAGVCGFGIGGNIVKKSLIDAEEYDRLYDLATAYTTCAENL